MQRRAIALGALLALAAVSTPARAQEVVRPYSRRGVYYFDGAVVSRLAGVGSRGAHASNRLALDDDHSVVTVDRERRRIVFRNTHRYGLDDLVGCLLFLGRGTTASGESVPLGVHLKIHKTRNRFHARLHPHPSVRDEIVAATFEPFEVVLSNGESETLALTPDGMREAVRDPALTARLAAIFLQVDDHLEGEVVHPEKPGARLVDLSIGFGSEKVHLDVARVQLVSKAAENAALIRSGALPAMFRHGSWELRIEAESPAIPPSEFKRQMFLFGLDDLGILDPLKRRGLLRGETLVVGLDEGAGFVEFDGARAEIADPADVARAYLEFHFVGGVLSQQVSQLPTRIR
jgi:hypothetical protein